MPCVGYFWADKPPADWVPLGALKDFPTDETRLVTFDNPLRQPWDGITAQTGVYVRYQGPDERRAGAVPGLGRQLRPPGLPGVVVSAVGFVHVSLPRRRLLRQRRTGSGPPPRGLFHCVWRVQRRTSWKFRPRIIRRCKTRLSKPA